jgi:hypothetical protein
VRRTSHAASIAPRRLLARIHSERTRDRIAVRATGLSWVNQSCSEQGRPSAGGQPGGDESSAGAQATRSRCGAASAAGTAASLTFCAAAFVLGATSALPARDVAEQQRIGLLACAAGQEVLQQRAAVIASVGAHMAALHASAMTTASTAVAKRLTGDRG